MQLGITTVQLATTTSHTKVYKLSMSTTGLHTIQSNAEFAVNGVVHQKAYGITATITATKPLHVICLTNPSTFKVS